MEQNKETEKRDASEYNSEGSLQSNLSSPVAKQDRSDSPTKNGNVKNVFRNSGQSSDSAEVKGENFTKGA
jgi:hypothetical protein